MKTSKHNDRSISRGAMVTLAAFALSASCAARTETAGEEPPPATRAWMDRLTVPHAYDPATGFIVAREVIALPPILAEGPSLAEAVRRGAEEDRVVIAFATADRCAPCQQYKLDALNEPRVVDRLADPRLIATHVEVDRDPAAAQEILGSRGVPMTYALREGEAVAVLRGQRSAEELIEWLNAVLGG